MVYDISILDESAKPIPGAKVTFTRDGGLLSEFTADRSGHVYIDDEFNADLFFEGVMVRATAPGYSYQGITSASLDYEWFFKLVKSTNYIPAVAAGAGLGILAYALAKRKKRVGGVFDNITPQTKNILLLGTAGIAAYLLIFKGRGANTDLPQNAAQGLQNLAAQGVYPTISEAEASAYAATIVSAADDCGTDESAIWHVFENLFNTADVLLLAKVYGIRQYKGCFDGDYLSWHKRNLSETLTSELSDGWINDINALLYSKGIDFKF